MRTLVRSAGCRLQVLYSIALVAAATLSAAAPPPTAADRLWFCPGPGTLDFIRLFERPDEWARTRQVIDVFKFYNQHTQSPADPMVGSNTYDALVRVDAFRQLRRWSIKTALEVGSVKEFFCDPASGGMETSARNTVASIRAMEAAGGLVHYIAMDEPWVSGRSPACGGPALEPTADMVAAYMTRVQRDVPRVAIGLIEAYPFSSAEAILRMLDLLDARGVPPAFLHMDVDWHALAEGAFARDMRRLKQACDARGIPFGIIVIGYNGDADALYAVDARGLSHLIADAFTTWEDMPQHVIFQSWVVTSTGLFITPSNLPEDRANTHTSLAWELFRRLRGATGGRTGTAVGR
jgi:hypothetical protein